MSQLNGEELPYTDFEFRIFIPRSLREANPSGAKHYMTKNKMRNVEIAVKSNHRSYPFFCSAQTMANDTVIFADYPTILKASDEAVDHITKSSYLGGLSKIRETFDARELTNFEKTIKLLLEEVPEAIAFRENITLIHLS